MGRAKQIILEGVGWILGYRVSLGKAYRRVITALSPGRKLQVVGSTPRRYAMVFSGEKHILILNFGFWAKAEHSSRYTPWDFSILIGFWAKSPCSLHHDNTMPCPPPPPRRVFPSPRSAILLSKYSNMTLILISKSGSRVFLQNVPGFQRVLVNHRPPPP